MWVIRIRPATQIEFVLVQKVLFKVSYNIFQFSKAKHSLSVFFSVYSWTLICRPSSPDMNLHSMTPLTQFVHVAVFVYPIFLIFKIFILSKNSATPKNQELVPSISFFLIFLL